MQAADTPAVAARLLSGLPIADLTIEDQPIESVIEQVFEVPGQVDLPAPADGPDLTGSRDEQKPK